jgi:hypothetical protein
MALADKTRATQQTADQSMIDGLTKNAATIGSLLIAGKTYTVAQAIALVQTALTASKTVVINHTALEASLQAETAVRTQNKPFYDGLTQTLQAMFAGQVSTLGDFGLKGRKVPVVAPATLVEAAAKAKATRAARGTKGPKARLTVTAAPAVATATPPAAAPVVETVTAPAAAPATAPTAPKS